MIRTTSPHGHNFASNMQDWTHHQFSRRTNLTGHGSHYTKHLHVETHLSSHTSFALGDTSHQTALRRDALQLQRILTETSTWTQQRLTHSTLTRRDNLDAHESLTHTVPDDDLHETPSTAPQYHLSHQRSSSSTALSTTTPCHPLHVAPPSDNHLSPRWHWHAYRLHPIASLTDDRPPRGASTDRLLRASAASNLRPCFDTNCWNKPTNQSHIAKWTHAETTFYHQVCVSHALNFSLFLFFFSQFSLL
jgi:hypothetical protein